LIVRIENAGPRRADHPSERRGRKAQHVHAQQNQDQAFAVDLVVKRQEDNLRGGVTDLGKRGDQARIGAQTAEARRRRAPLRRPPDAAAPAAQPAAK
jgi:hypothetical protein